MVAQTYRVRFFNAALFPFALAAKFNVSNLHKFSLGPADKNVERHDTEAFKTCSIQSRPNFLERMFPPAPKAEEIISLGHPLQLTPIIRVRRHVFLRNLSSLAACSDRLDGFCPTFGVFFISRVPFIASPITRILMSR